MVRLRAILKSTALPPATTVTLSRPGRVLEVQGFAVGAPGTRRTLVSGTSFQLPAGTGLAVLGASASGKSSLTKALVGV